MEIRQFYDKALAHASYAVLCNGEMIIVDPSRDPTAYYQFAESRSARIIGVVETHPHADFVSGHKEISDTVGCPVYCSKLVGAEYHHIPYDEGDRIKISKLTLAAINTPGHSPDSICILVTDEEGKEQAILTGDTLFVGDVGRPDLREQAGNITAAREEMARAMYETTREKIMVLPTHVAVYPAHGPGSLCGKSLGSETTSTIGQELRNNYALQRMSEDEFVDVLLEDQPYVPKYFSHCVAINRTGAQSVEEALSEIPMLTADDKLDTATLIVDTRPASDYMLGHNKNSINIPDAGRFETWLGSVISPDEEFYLLAATGEDLDRMLRKAAKIGYEQIVKGAVLADPSGPNSSKNADLKRFADQPESFTVVDVRNESEVAEHKPFDHSLNIPLNALRDRMEEIPRGKPIMVHCAAGYRSAIASSIIASEFKKERVYDLGEAIHEFNGVMA